MKFNDGDVSADAFIREMFVGFMIAFCAGVIVCVCPMVLCMKYCQRPVPVPVLEDGERKEPDIEIVEFTGVVVEQPHGDRTLGWRAESAPPL